MTTHRERDKLAADTTWQASKLTFLIFRFFADRDRLYQAYRSYAYFRWLDDLLDAPNVETQTSERTDQQVDLPSQAEKLNFVRHQRELLEGFYQSKRSQVLDPMEMLLMDLVDSDPDPNSGLYLYLNNMMKVMEFDAERRCRQVSRVELEEYTTTLAIAVTELLHYFIGHDQIQPRNDARYKSVKAAHITHMLRDTAMDIQEGYFNIPEGYLNGKPITAFDIGSDAYREWVASQVLRAQKLFRSGQKYISQGKSLKRRIAGLAYTSRFMWVLHTIKKENHYLRESYADRKSFSAILWMFFYMLKTLVISPFQKQRYITLTSSEDKEGKI